MGHEITLFSPYDGAENRLTNYCGLILRELYADSPAGFANALAAMLPSDIAARVGPVFSQQVSQGRGTKRSTPDLLVSQESFAICIETKLEGASFTNEQLERHLNGIDKTSKTRVLIALANFDHDDPQTLFGGIAEKAAELGVHLQTLSFEDFVARLGAVASSERFRAILQEFETFLDENDHLPRWKYLLDVVNCGQSIEEVRAVNAYMCPADTAAHSHKRAKFFGAYARKTVSVIYEIDAVVKIAQQGTDAILRWKNKTSPDADLIEKALKTLQVCPARLEENAYRPMQVFLLSCGHETNFRKSSPGGMLQSKKYFWDIASLGDTAASLARRLHDQTWEDPE